MRVRRDGGTAIQSRFQSNVAFQQQIVIAGKSIMRVYGVRVRPERADMKKLSIGMALASAFAGSVFAADLPASMPVYAPRASVVPPLYSWTGCYIGPNVGGGWSGTTFKDTTTLIRLETKNAASGVFGGGQVGCDYQYGWGGFGTP